MGYYNTPTKIMIKTRNLAKAVLGSCLLEETA